MSPIPAHRTGSHSGSRTGSHANFRGTYLKRLRTFIEESDSAVGRRLHRRLAQDLAARVVKSTDNPASGHPRSPVGHRIVYLIFLPGSFLLALTRTML